MSLPVQSFSGLPPAVIIGNGPSLRGFDFCNRLKSYATFGMNAAYRFWDTCNWYPQYYSCLDTVVGLSHCEAIRRLIDRAKEYGILRFLLRDNLIRILGEYGQRPEVTNFEEEVTNGNLLLKSPMITTGSHTCAWAASLGYHDIVLIGMDANYIPIIKEARSVDGIILEVVETPRENPNYFFDDYQMAGDRYHIPNHQSDPDKATHLESWRGICMPLAYEDIVVVNATPQSRVDVFPHCEFTDALSSIARIREGRRQQANAPGLLGIYPRNRGASLKEEKIFAELFHHSNGLMIDVGALQGDSLLPFLKRGWTVHAFEPEPNHRAVLKKNTADFSSMYVDSRAVSKVSGRSYPFYTSPESCGVSSMLPFLPSHKKCCTVTTVTLRDYCREHKINAVDFLKIDAEGFDFMVLQGFPFESITPQGILCEFEDKKSVPIGASMHLMARFLQTKGYDVYISEWHPIRRYGIAHEWRRIVSYPTETAVPSAWGNILAFKTPPAREAFENAIQRALNFHTVISI